jgi:hypothetical protein
MSPPDTLTSSARSLVYVYGLIRLPAADLVAPISQIAPVRIVSENELVALVSTIEDDFDDRLKDPEEAKRMVLAHHGVLTAVCRTRAVLPMRFGTVFADDASLRGALCERHDALLAALCRLDGTREWGVKIFCDRMVLRDHLMETPIVAAAQSEASAAPQGRAFFLKRRVAQLRDAEVDHAVARDLDAGRRSLIAAAQGEVAMKLQPSAVSGRADDMVWNGAYLVAETDEDGFFTQVETLRRALAPSGYACEMTGPWPPFNFADCRLEA